MINNLNNFNKSFDSISNYDLKTPLLYDVDLQTDRILDFNQERAFSVLVKDNLTQKEYFSLDYHLNRIKTIQNNIRNSYKELQDELISLDNLRDITIENINRLFLDINSIKIDRELTLKFRDANLKFFDVIFDGDSTLINILKNGAEPLAKFIFDNKLQAVKHINDMLIELEKFETLINTLSFQLVNFRAIFTRYINELNESQEKIESHLSKIK